MYWCIVIYTPVLYCIKLLNMPCEIRNKQFLRCVKTQARKFREKLVVDKDLVKQVFIEEQRLELGRFRHGERFMNYDDIVALIQERWLETNHGLCQEIIHSVSNKANDILLECIYEVMLKKYNRAVRKADVLEILLNERTKELNALNNKLKAQRNDAIYVSN